MDYSEQGVVFLQNKSGAEGKPKRRYFVPNYRCQKSFYKIHGNICAKCLEGCMKGGHQAGQYAYLQKL